MLPRVISSKTTPQENKVLLTKENVPQGGLGRVIFYRTRAGEVTFAAGRPSRKSEKHFWSSQYFWSVTIFGQSLCWICLVSQC
jgi:hypothetical protein